MTTLVDAPARVDGVQLIGEMAGSGYRTPPALVRRGDGQVLQLTPLLYLVLSTVDGRRTCADIAEVVGRALNRSVSETDVRTLVDGHLRPLGLLKTADGSEPETRRADPLLGLKPRFAITDPSRTRRLTDPFRVLFRRPIVVAVVAAFVVIVAWVFFDRGLGASAYDAFQRPHLLLLVFVVAVLSGGFHEFGHAAATRYSGGTPGAMGAGLYLVWPAFYTDVTDSYRLDRAGRIRTDLGGLYFNAIIVVGTFIWWWSTGWEALLILVAVQVLQMVQQLLPLLRFDGYHVLADVAGVPDLYQRIRPTLLGLLPHRWKSPENRVLKPSARVLITLWVFVTIPMMALMLLAVVMAVPRLLGSAQSVMGESLKSAGHAWSAGNYLDVAAFAAQMLSVLLPSAACVLILCRTGIRFFRGLARWSQGSTAKRAVAAALSVVVVAGLGWAWWPSADTYKPIQPGERGTITNILPFWNPGGGEELGRPLGGAAPPARISGTAAHSRLDGGEPLMAVFQKGQALPTKEHPALAMVLVPVDEPGGNPSPSTGDPAGSAAPQAGGSAGAGSPETGAATGGTASSADGTWVFPFDKPLPPAEGDNQALAVATQDGSITYDIAFALVWAEGDEVLNVNEAHAYASCTDCVAVAVAFQVVLIMDNAKVVVPQNLAVAANYNCYQCITAAIASQLVFSVQGEPGQEQLSALQDVWNQLVEFAANITSYSLTQVAAQLETFKTQIVGILEGGGSVPASPAAPAPTPAPAPTSAPDSPTTSAPPTAATPSPSPAPVPSTTYPAPPTPESTTEPPMTQPPPTQATTTAPPAAETTPPPPASATSDSPTAGSASSPSPSMSPSP